MRLVVGTFDERVAILRDSILEIFSPDNLQDPVMSAKIELGGSDRSIEWLDNYHLIVTTTHSSVLVQVDNHAKIMTLPPVHRPKHAPVYARAFDAIVYLNRIQSTDCITMTSLKTGETVAFALQTAFANTLCVHPTLALFAYGDIENVVLSAANGFVLRRFTATGCVTHLQWAQAGETLLVADCAGIKILDKQLKRKPDCEPCGDSFAFRDELVRVKSVDVVETPHAFAVHENLVAVLEDKFVQIWDLARSVVLRQVKFLDRIDQVVWDDGTAYVVSNGEVATVWPGLPAGEKFGLHVLRLARVSSGMVASSQSSIAYIPRS